MSRDYTIKVKTKDGVELGECFVNEIKNIIDFMFIRETLNFDHNKTTFSYKELSNVRDKIENVIKDEYSKIFMKTLLSNTATIDVKHELDEEILDIRDYINDLFVAYYGISSIIGKICAMSEDRCYKTDEKFILADDTIIEIECHY